MNCQEMVSIHLVHNMEYVWHNTASHADTVAEGHKTLYSAGMATYRMWAQTSLASFWERSAAEMRMVARGFQLSVS